MKNKVLVVICAIIFTVTMLAGCGGNDNPAANTDASEVGQEDIDKLIIGSKWMPTEVDGQPMLTNQKLVYNFTSSTTALISGSYQTANGCGGQGVSAVHPLSTTL